MPPARQAFVDAAVYRRAVAACVREYAYFGMEDGVGAVQQREADFKPAVCDEIGGEAGIVLIPLIVSGEIIRIAGRQRLDEGIGVALYGGADDVLVGLDVADNPHSSVILDEAGEAGGDFG